jgi:hypothetical protein
MKFLFYYKCVKIRQEHRKRKRRREEGEWSERGREGERERGDYAILWKIVIENG